MNYDIVKHAGLSEKGKQRLLSVYQESNLGNPDTYLYPAHVTTLFRRDFVAYDELLKRIVVTPLGIEYLQRQNLIHGTKAI